jgi:cellulose synthase/poly-beta-1,6-N-acetylglucosamine synthase-like glycosyltransferase
MTIWIGLLVGILLVWLTRHIELARAGKQVVTLRPSDARGALPSVPKVSVLVAAKDEEANIGTCAATWLTQDYPDYEVIIIDDRSTDRTGEILRDIRKSDPHGANLQVLTVQELPAGWAGKNNAMRMGIQSARGQWLLLSDADCRQTCDQTISVAMNYALREKVDLLSILPVLDTQTVWERIIQPVAGAVMVYWFNPVKVNDPAGKAAYANGAFMLIRKDAYEAVGGHAAVRRQLNEDLHMAKLIKQQGLRLRVVQSEGLYLTRMYRNFHETWRGWSRIFYGCFGSVGRLLISMMFLLVMSLLPWFSLAAGWAAVAAGAGGRWRWVAYMSTATILAQLSVLTRFYKISKSHVRYVITWPIGAALCVGMLTSAIFKTLGWTGTAWRGRVYTQGQAAARPQAAPPRQEVRS